MKTLTHITKNKYFKDAKLEETWYECDHHDGGTYTFTDSWVDSRKFIEGEMFIKLGENLKSGHIHCQYYVAEVKPNEWRKVPLESVKMVQRFLD